VRRHSGLPRNLIYGHWTHDDARERKHGMST